MVKSPSRAVRYYRNHSIDELDAMIEQVRADPRHQTAKGNLFTLTPPARKKIDDMGWAITWHLRDMARAKGLIVRGM